MKNSGAIFILLSIYLIGVLYVLRIFWVLAFLAFLVQLWLIVGCRLIPKILIDFGKVLQAERVNCLKTALKVLEEILDKTKNEDELRGHYLKALCWKALNQAHIQVKSR